MKSKLSLALLALPAAFSGYVVFHPGVAFAEPTISKIAPQAPLEQAAGSYTVDPFHTSVGFEIDHLGVSRVQGRFNKVSGRVKADPKNLNGSSVEITIATDSIDTAVAPRDTHLKSADFFEVAKYPEITFRSTKIRKRGKNYVADGVLTIKGVAKPVSIPFKSYGPITDPWGNTRAGIVADPIKINRQDYGIAYNDKLPSGVPSVGNEVTIRISAEATKDKPK